MLVSAASNKTSADANDKLEGYVNEYHVTSS